MNNKSRRERSFETVFVQSEAPIDLRITVSLIVEKFNRRELNGYERRKREIREATSGDSASHGYEEHSD